MKMLLLASLMLASTAALSDVVQDDACFAISGTRYDHNGALNHLSKHEKTQARYPFAGYQCRVFNSYTELKTHLLHANLPLHSSILVLQIAHGGIGGTGFLNGSGQTSAEKILSEVRSLTKNYKVAFINESCFSGTLIQEKLLWDEANQASESIDRSCMWSLSSPGRVAFSTSNISRIQSDYTLEEAYQKKPDGILSSAAWSEVKMSAYYQAIAQQPGYLLRNPNTLRALYPQASAFLKGVSSVLESSPETEHSRIYANAQFVMDPTVSDSKIKSAIKASTGAGFDKESVRQAIFFPPASTDACTLAVRKFLVSQWYITFTNGDDIWDRFLSALKSGLATYPGVVPACQDLGQENLTALDWARWLMPHSSLGLELEKYAATVDDQNPKLISNPLYYDYSSYTSKQETLLSIIGRTILPEETQVIANPDGTRMSAGYPNIGKKGATGNVLPAFVLSSLRQSSMKNSLDQRRRDACRDIELKGW